MFNHRGKSAVMSVPADTEFAAIFVPNCASAKAKDIMNTPNLAGPLAVAPVFGLTKKYDSRFNGFQMGSPYITAEEDDTMMPMKEVTAKPTGIVIS